MTRLRPARAISALATLLAAAALLASSGCGFLCTDDSQCRSNICRVPLCATARAKLTDLGPPTDLNELLMALLPPLDVQP